MSAKQKIVHGRRPSNIDLGIFICCFDVCRASQPFPVINHGKSGPENSRESDVSKEKEVLNSLR